MGMFDEVSIKCPECQKYILFQSKAGPCTLTCYSLKNAPLAVLASLNEKGKNDRLYCEYCNAQLEIPIRFTATVRVKTGQHTDEELREE